MDLKIEPMNWLLELNSSVNSIVWGTPMMIALIGSGLFLTFATRGVQFSKFLFSVRQVLTGRRHPRAEGSVSPFQALATSMSATVGVGNIAGVSIAIATGGPGAVLWMFVTGLVGMATKYSEIAVALEYRSRDEQGELRGGAMYILEKRFGLRWLGVIFAINCSLAAFGIGNMTQANTVANGVHGAFGIPAWLTGLILAGLTALVIIGGIRRIAEVTSVLAPLMCVLYIACALGILFAHFRELPSVIALVIDSAFNGHAAIGGFLGATVRTAARTGVARGLFSSEAGLGSAPIVHAAAVTDHPARQAVYGIFGVFLDTLVVCMLTASIVLATGVWDSGQTGAELTALAFNQGLAGEWGGQMVAIAVSMFGFSTIIGWAYYGETGIAYLFGLGSIKVYRVIWTAAVFVGAIGGLEVVWKISDTMNALMAIPNLIAVLGSVAMIRSQIHEFFEMRVVRRTVD